MLLFSFLCLFLLLFSYFFFFFFNDTATTEIYTLSLHDALPISVTRQSEREKLPIDGKIMISQALKGPVRRIAAEHVMNCHVIWEFAENKDGAQQFLIDFMDHFHEGFVAGQF